MSSARKDDGGSERGDPVTGDAKEAPICVVVATYNERENIIALIPAILSLGQEYHVLVVDDESPDGTGPAVAEFSRRDERVHLLARPGRGGYGSAVMDGLKLALDLKARRILTMDADFSHNPADLPLLNEILNNADIAIGSRYLGGIRILNWSFGRLLLSVGANKYIHFILRLSYSDCTSGFRGYRRNVVKSLVEGKFTSRGYAFLVEILFAAERAGYKISEGPIIYTERRAGQSKMSKATIWEAVFRPWLLLARGLFGGRGLHVLQD